MQRDFLHPDGLVARQGRRKVDPEQLGVLVANVTRLIASYVDARKVANMVVALGVGQASRR